MALNLHRSRLLVAACALGSIALLPAPAAAEAAAAVSAPGFTVPLLAGPEGTHAYVAPLVQPPEVGTEAATIVVTYHGFTPQAQNAFQHAVDLWEELIVSPVTINLDASFTSLGQGILGSAGPQNIYANSCPAMTTNTWYPSALANAVCGVDIDGDIEGGADFNSDFSSWYFGTDGNPGGGQYDFESVVMHEMGHMLGFIGSMNVIGSSGTWGGFFPCLTCPFIYDRFAEDGNGMPLLSYTRGSVALGNALRGQVGGGVFFDGPATNAANDNGVGPPDPAALYAPSTWQSGSSFSHPDEATFNDTANALMTPILDAGEAIHSPGPVVLGTFSDMGWTLPNAPGAATGLATTAGSNAVKVSFNPAPDGGSAVTKYTVVASPGGAVGEGLDSPVWVAGLDNNTAYTFTVQAENAFGVGPVAGPSPPATPHLHGFHPVDPVRIVDTRFGTSASCPTCQAISGARAPNSTTTVSAVNPTVPSSPVPADADTVVLNVTATSPSKAGWLTIWDTSNVPIAANLNFAAGQTVPNLVTVKLGPSGTVKLGNTNGVVAGPTVHVIMDVVGWYDNGITNPGGVPYEPVTPTRILDTRFGNSVQCPSCQGTPGALAPGSNNVVDVAGLGGVDPAATAIVMNVTVTGPTKPGWLTVWPSGSVPNAANLNFVAGQTVANLVTVKLNGSGDVHIGNTIGAANPGTVHVIIDVMGWYGTTALGGGLNAATPERILDTRQGVPGANPRNTPLFPQEETEVQVAGYGRVPPTGVGTVVVNVTAVSPTSMGWFTVWPGGTIPNAANLNFVAGQTVPNLVIVGLGPNGRVRLANTDGCSCAGFTNAVFDVSGWFAPPPLP